MTKSSDSILRLNEHVFATRLREAVHDKRHEDASGQGLIHYWDSSCMAFPLWGFRELPENYPNVRTAQQVNLLVGALFSSGQLGQVQLLPGHAVEFATLARGEGRSSSRSLKEFVKNHRSELSELDFLLDRGASRSADFDDAQQQIEVMVRRIRDLKPSLFVLLESISASPQSRVAKWLRNDPPLVRFALNPKLEGFSVEQPPFGEFLDALDLMRPSGRHGDRNRNPVDASVLGSLARLATQDPPYPRFYTNTPTLINLSEVPWVKDYFSYEYRTQSGEGYPGSIWRTAEYYYLRSLFPALSLGSGMPSDEGDSTESHAPDLEELATFSTALDRALRDSDKFDKFIERHRLSNGQRVSEIIATFQSIGMAHVWLNFRPGDMARNLVDGVRELSVVGENRKSRAVVESMWRGLDDVSRDLSELRFVVHVVESISGRFRSMRGTWMRSGMAASSRRSETMKLGHISEYFLVDDILGQRWGSRTSVDLEDVLKRIASDPAASSELLPFFDLHRLRSQAGSSTLTAILALMYGLELFDLMIDFVDRIDAELALESHLLKLAAQVRVAGSTGTSEVIPGIVRSVERLWATATDEIRYDMCLGFGHSLLEAVVAEGATSFSKIGRSGIRFGEVQRVMKYVEDNLGRMKGESQAKFAFAVNFLAYSSIIVPWDDLGSEFAAELHALLKVDRFSRQYRFVDTLIYRELRHTLGFVGARFDRDEACKLLGLLTRQLEDLVATTRSSTISGHLEEARVGREFLGCR